MSFDVLSSCVVYFDIEEHLLSESYIVHVRALMAVALRVVLLRLVWERGQLYSPAFIPATYTFPLALFWVDLQARGVKAHDTGVTTSPPLTIGIFVWAIGVHEFPFQIHRSDGNLPADVTAPGCKVFQLSPAFFIL